MLRESRAAVEMVQRNMTGQDALRAAYAALQDGHFARARDLTAPIRTTPAGHLLHALARAGAGDVAAAADLHAIAQANPAARHPVHDLIDLLRRLGREAEAAPHLRAALRHAPDDPALFAALGTEAAATGSIAEAVDAFHHVTRLRPLDSAAWSNLGKALAAALRFTEAEDAFTRAASLAPNDPQLALNHAVARLRSGRMAEGWARFRHRHRLPGRPAPPPGRELTTLDDAPGRTVLLVHNEGFGDTIQFIRYAALLQSRGARILVAAPPALARLLAGQGLELAGPAPRYDTWCRIADLPALFGTTADTIPAALPYITPDAALVASWSARLPSAPRRIGLVWAGAGRLHDPAAAATDRLRSIPQPLLAPLLACPGVTWISLQHARPAPPAVFDPMPDVADFADTAAIIASLDQVVSVDTAVAHLAAAMDRPVLLLDRHDGCWRWFTGREDSPWYPGALRILRQDTPGDWVTVLYRAARIIAPG